MKISRRRKHQFPHKMLKKKLQQHNLSPQQFANISGMPLTEVEGLLEGRLPFTILRANHLAAVFDTKPEIWLNGSKNPQTKPDLYYSEE